MTTVFFCFEKGSKSEIFAYFPDVPHDNIGNFTCYSHVGQHSSCSPKYFSECEVITKKSVYQPLKNELISIGYNELVVINEKF